MGYDISVLRAIVRLTCRRIPANQEALLVRVPGHSADLRASLRRLERAGLVRVGKTTASLTLSGLAVAVASMPARRTSPALRTDARAA